MMKSPTLPVAESHASITAPGPPLTPVAAAAARRQLTLHAPVGDPPAVQLRLAQNVVPYTAASDAFL